MTCADSRTNSNRSMTDCECLFSPSGTHCEGPVSPMGQTEAPGPNATHTVHTHGARDPLGGVVELRVPEPSEHMRLKERVELETVLVAASSAITAGEVSSDNSRWAEILPGLEQTTGRLIEGENVRRRSTRLVKRVQLRKE